MKDRFGNPIRAGQQLFWVNQGLKAKCVAVQGLTIKIEVELTLPQSPDNPEIQVADFVVPAEPKPLRVQ